MTRFCFIKLEEKNVYFLSSVFTILFQECDIFFSLILGMTQYHGGGISFLDYIS